MQANQTQILPNTTTYSQRRVRQLRNRSDHIGNQFKTNNFYEGAHLNVPKLRQKIYEAKQKLMLEKQREKQYKHKSYIQTKQQLNNPYIDIHFNARKQKNPISKVLKKGLTTYQTIDNNNDQTLTHKQRMVTDLGYYEVTRKRTLPKNQKINKLNEEINSRVSSINNNDSGLYGNIKVDRFSSLDIPSARHTKSVSMFEVENKKVILKQKQELREFESKIKILWELYEKIVQMMQHASKSNRINEKAVAEYVEFISSQKLEFIHDVCQLFTDSRMQRTIKMGRVLQNFSVFETCLNSLQRKKKQSAEIINYLGYSSSSLIFLIKILILSHQTSLPFSFEVNQIVASIIQFQVNSYKAQLRNIKQVFRRLEHNNEIIGMIKTRCGKRHGKYCQQFITKVIKSVEKEKFPFHEWGNNIFQFLAFYLHFQNIAEYLPLLSTPPSPFLSLSYPRTVIIEPWGVLAYKKNKKLVIRAHTGKFLAQILDNCNLVFWTELMPKDAQILTNLLPIRDNIHWLYQYHCKHEKSIKVKMVEMVGCDEQNTIIIDNNPEHYMYNEDIGINMLWTGQKNDTKLMLLSENIQHIFEQSNKSRTSLKQQLKKLRPDLDNILKGRKRSKSKSRIIKSSAIKYTKIS